MRPRAVRVAAAAIVLALAACSSSPAAQSASGPTGTAATSAAPAASITPTSTAPKHDKAGNVIPAATTTLKAVCYCTQNRPQADVMARLVDEVARNSNGSLTLDVTYEVEDAWKQYQSGAYDMMLTPTRSLSSMGVTTFDALTAPFAVNDDDQANRVATDPLIDEMMAGLSAIGSTGLLLAPVYEQHLAIAGGGALHSLTQLHTDVRLDDAPDQQLDNALPLLGGRAHHNLDHDAWTAAVASGESTASVWPTVLAGGTPGPQRMATNFTLFYDFAVVIVHDSSLQKLPAASADLLRSAAKTAAKRTVDERKPEAAAFTDACAADGDFTAVPTYFISQVGHALQSWLLDQERDPTRKHFADAIRRVAGAHAVPKPQECAHGTTTDYAPAAPPATTFPEGTYRSQPHTADSLLAIGVSRDTASSNGGWDYAELTIAKGTATLSFHDPKTHQLKVACVQRYTVDGTGRLVLERDATNDCGADRQSWTIDGDKLSIESGISDDPVVRQVVWDISPLLQTDLVKVG